jgi:hypothetical protein
MKRRLSEVKEINIKGFDDSKQWNGHNTFSGTITYTDGMLQTFSTKYTKGKDFLGTLAATIKDTLGE